MPTLLDKVLQVRTHVYQEGDSSRILTARTLCLHLIDSQRDQSSSEELAKAYAMTAQFSFELGQISAALANTQEGLNQNPCPATRAFLLNNQTLYHLHNNAYASALHTATLASEMARQSKDKLLIETCESNLAEIISGHARPTEIISYPNEDLYY